jgi:hypothetical protein
MSQNNLFSLAPTIHVPWEIADAPPSERGDWAMRVLMIKDGDAWTIVVSESSTRTLTTDELPEAVRENLATVMAMYPEDPNRWYTSAYEHAVKKLFLNHESSKHSDVEMRAQLDSRVYISAMIPPTQATDARWELVREHNAGWRVSESMYCVIVSNRLLKKLKGETSDTGEKS